MADGNSPLSLAYLIEISIVLNIGYKELAFEHVSKKLQKAMNEVEEHLADLRETYSVKFDSQCVPDLFFGKASPWGEEHKKEQRFYANWLINWRASKWSGWAVIGIVALLVACTLGTKFNVVSPWFWWPAFSVLFLLTLFPIVLYAKMNQCLKALVGYSDFSPQPPRTESDPVQVRLTGRSAELFSQEKESLNLIHADPESLTWLCYESILNSAEPEETPIGHS